MSEFYNPEFFLAPPARFRPIPFWFWNLDISRFSRKRLEKTIDDMSEKGLGGFIIFNKKQQGFSAENYLGPKWMNLVRTAALHGASRGMEVWINDGLDCPPYDIAGAWRTLCPEAAPQSIKRRSAAVQGPCVFTETFLSHEFVSAFIRPENKSEEAQIIPGKRSGRETIVSVQIPEGKFTIDFFSINEIRLNIDLPSLRHPAVSRQFIKYTYDRYLEELGDLLGREITGFFSDADGYEWHDFPAYNGLWEDFEKKTGVDLKVKLPLLFDGQKESRIIRKQYYTVLSEAYEKWFAANSRWCGEHNLKYSYHTSDTGPFLIDPLKRPFCRRSSYFCEGNFFQINQHADFVGTDHELEALAGNLHFTLTFADAAEKWPFRESIAGEKNLCRGPERDFPNRTFGDIRAKCASSLAHIRKRSGALCEQFAACNWELSFQTMRLLAGWQISQGITRIVPHAWFESLDGERRSFAPPAISPGTMLHRHYQVFADWLSRALYLAQLGAHAADIALLEPGDEVWKGDPSSARAAQFFFTAADWLNHSPYDYDIFDKKALLDASIADGYLLLHEETYRCLVLSFLPENTDSLWPVINKFQNSGGIVLVLGNCEVKEFLKIPDDILRNGMDNRFQIPAVNSLTSCLAELIPPDVIIHRIDSSGLIRTCGIHFLHRSLNNNEDIYMLFNLEENAGWYDVSIKNAGSMEMLNPENGKHSPLKTEIRSSRSAFKIFLEQGEVKAFLLKRSDRPLDSAEDTGQEYCLEITHAEKFRPLEQNLVPLHLWIEDGKYKKWQEIKQNASLSLFAEEEISDAELLVPEILFSSLTNLFISSQPVMPENIINTRLWDSPYRCLKFGTLPAGEIQLSALIKSALEDISYTPVYLRGHFAVDIIPGTITSLLPHHHEYWGRTYLSPGQKIILRARPKGLCLTAWEKQGYPFYSGTMEYIFTFCLPKKYADAPACIKFGKARDVVEAELDGKILGQRIWRPYDFFLPGGINAGDHTLTVKVTNTSANIFEETPLVSGLLEPVRIVIIG